ncbi:MAG: sigma-70 family RNA polymerase sigma factor, partial [Clostridia bacterium]
VQETFFKAYKGLDDFRGESAEKTWLMRIAINTCKDIRRGAWYRFVDRHVTLDRVPVPTVPSKAENVLITMDVMRLPTKECEAVLLRYYQNMNVKEIAQALGVSSTAISKRLRRALQRLNLDWEGEQENE